MPVISRVRRRPPVTQAVLDEKIDQAVAEQVDERMAAVSWAERIRWKGDFRYRYENIDEEGKDGRNRSRIRARTALVADVTPTVEVGLGLATGGDDPVSANVTLGGGGSKKEINLDLAYFDWSGLANTHVLGGKFSNYLVKPQKTALLWDGDWRPEGLGIVWDNGTFFAQGLGTWLEGDSRNGTEFGWVAQAGMKLKLGETGKLMFGGGYSEFDIAGGTPLFGDPDDFYGNSFVEDPVTGNLVFAYNYHEIAGLCRVQLRSSPAARSPCLPTTSSTRMLTKTTPATCSAPSTVPPRHRAPGTSRSSTRNSKRTPWSAW